MAIQITSTSSGWREIVVKYTCARCRKVAYLSYSEAMGGNECYHLNQSKLPEGWKEEGYSRIFCTDCAKAFEKFMEG